MTEYPKIQTLYERDLDTFKVKRGEFKNPVYSMIKTWQWTEKVDGTNIRLIWNEGKLSFGGRTNNAQLPGRLVNWLTSNVTADTMQCAVGEADVVIYGEGFGAGIQKHGGLYGSEQRFIVFDVLVGGKQWLNYEDTLAVATGLGLPMVPYFGEMSLDEATDMVKVGVQSRCSSNEMAAEGLVGRPKETLYDQYFQRLIIKLKTKDF